MHILYGNETINTRVSITSNTLAILITILSLTNKEKGMI